jgi:hypothetical protein
LALASADASQRTCAFASHFASGGVYVHSPEHEPEHDPPAFSSHVPWHMPSHEPAQLPCASWTEQVPWQSPRHVPSHAAATSRLQSPRHEPEHSRFGAVPTHSTFALASHEAIALASTSHVPSH